MLCPWSMKACLRAPLSVSGRGTTYKKDYDVMCNFMFDILAAVSAEI